MTAIGHQFFQAIFSCLITYSLVSSVYSAPDKAGWAEHWSFKKLERPPVPAKGNPVDAFVREKLMAKGVKQNARADRYTLIRRVTLDLTGLPPTREEIADFVNDLSPDSVAWEKLVDRLLASPHYGERWGRHWLDVARYVQGTVKVPGIDQIDLAESYRDYVVRSFNEDKPWDQFIAEQLAGDLLPIPADDRKQYFDQIVAPAFLSIGPWFDECTDPNKLRFDIIDEQISTLSRAFLAMDFNCSRCHDHKFDPIPMRDYYAMAGIFRSTVITEKYSQAWRDGRPRLTSDLAMPSEIERNRSWEEAISKLRATRWDFLKTARKRIIRDHSRNIAEVSQQVPIAKVEAENFAGYKNLKISENGKSIQTRRALDQWVKYNIQIPETADYLIYIRYASSRPAPLQMEINGTTQPDEILASPTGGDDPIHYRWEECGPYSFKKGNNPIRLKVPRHRPFPRLDALQIILNRSTSSDDIVVKRAMRSADFWPPSIADSELLLNEIERKALTKIDLQIQSHQSKIVTYPVALTASDAPKIRDVAIRAGGNPNQPNGDPVPRGVPSLGGLTIAIPKDESGRIQLADWLTRRENPLTARVTANRIWHWHFGRGIVRTVDDFGMQGDLPSHGKLLDWLAVELIDNDWSIKCIHRLILLSETYQISVTKTPENTKNDADGALLSRYPRRRLETEAIYDSMLTSIGKVQRQQAGTPLNTGKSKDRALYILTSSRSPLGLGLEIRKMFPLFGYDASGRPIHVRDNSLSPNQSLWWLNNPLPGHYAGKLASKILKEHSGETERITSLFETVLGRPPGKNEKGGLRDYLKSGMHDLKLSEQDAWARACLGLFSSDSFSNLE